MMMSLASSPFYNRKINYFFLQNFQPTISNQQWKPERAAYIWIASENHSSQIFFSNLEPSTELHRCIYIFFITFCSLQDPNFVWVKFKKACLVFLPVFFVSVNNHSREDSSFFISLYRRRLITNISKHKEFCFRYLIC